MKDLLAKIQPRILNLAVLIVPFILWMYLLRDFLFTNQMIIDDAVHFYDRIKFFLEGVLRSQFPLWNYLEGWGRPQSLELRYFGELNPFLWIIVILKQLGLPFISAYLTYKAMYYFVGLLGFYLLACRLFADRRLAFVAYMLLMFSSLGTNLFNNFAAILLFVPIVWFFYFLVAFTGRYSKLDFLGLTFTAMILAVTYIPVYFLIIFLSFVIGFVILYFRQTKEIISNTFKFFMKNKLLVILCLLAVGLSCLPGYLWYQQSADEFVTPFRQGSSPLDHPASMSISVINVGGISGFISLKEIFSGLDQTKVGTFYIPIFAYLLVVLSIANTLTRRVFLLFAVSLLMILISLADVTPVHKYFYDRIFFFKYFRILYFVFALAIPIFILFCVEQFRLLLKDEDEINEKKPFLIWFVFVAHVAFGAFLYYEGGVIPTSFITVVLSFLFFAIYFKGYIKADANSFIGLICIVMAVQPIEVFSAIRSNAKDLKLQQNSEIQIQPYGRDQYLKPHFSYTRPLRGSGRQRNEGQLYRSEHSGFLGNKYKGVKIAYYLYKNMDEQILQDYVRNKFYVYDSVESVAEGEIDLTKIEKAFAKEKNLAFVFGEAEEPDNVTPAKAKSKKVQIITEDSDQFQILDFDFTHITFKTNFDVPKFIVYNDSFHSGWSAMMNGEQNDLYRANVAFKGLWVPAGENTVSLQFEKKNLYRLNWMLMILFAAMFLCLLWTAIKGIFDDK